MNSDDLTRLHVSKTECVSQFLLAAYDVTHLLQSLALDLRDSTIDASKGSSNIPSRSTGKISGSIIAQTHITTDPAIHQARYEGKSLAQSDTKVICPFRATKSTYSNLLIR